MEYIPVLIMLGAGALIGIGAIVISRIIGPKIAHPQKELPFECGVPAASSTRQRISVRFFLVAILFLLFDVEVVFFFPWGVVFKEYLAINNFILWEMGAFVGILLIGYFYVLKKGALNWE